MNQLPHNTALIVIDVQRAFDHPSWGRRNNPGAESQVAALLAAWRAARMPVIHIHHRSGREASMFHAGGHGVEVKPEAVPADGEPVLYKDVNSGFIGTDLESRLRGAGLGTVVLAGITTDHCVSTTARMAGNLGFDTVIVSDATATFERTGPDGRRFSAELMHETALASVHGEFAQVADTAGVIAMIGPASATADTPAHSRFPSSPGRSHHRPDHPGHPQWPD